MAPESLGASVVQGSHDDPLVPLCEDFDRRWSVGDLPRIEEFLNPLPVEERPAVFARLLTIELAHRSIAGETISEQAYRERFPEYVSELESILHADVSFGCAESNNQSLNTTLVWEQIARAVNPVAIHQSGDMVDRYQLVQRIGRGGFGEVWKAIDTELARNVAIKLARSDRAVSKELMELLRAEARHAASLRHSGIVPVYDIARTPNGTYIVSEFIHGETLASRLRHGALPTTLAVKFAIQIAEALHHAHLCGLVHRDVKPGNILLRSPGDEALLTDFGLAVTEIDQLRERRSTVGTWWYMSPEQARGESNRVDARSDLYSLGVVFYQMLTGRLPFVADTREAYIDQVLNRAPRPLRTIDDTIDSELERICLKCLAKDVTERFTTSMDFAVQLRGCKGWQDRPRPLRRGLRDMVRPVGFAAVSLVLIIIFVSVAVLRMPDYVKPSKNDQTNLLMAVAAPGNEVVGDVQPINKLIPLMTRQPSLFAWALGERREKPLFDADGQIFAVRAPNNRWIATTGQFKSDDFELSAEVSVKDWLGSVGFVWHLASDPQLAPREAFRCLAVEYERTRDNLPPRLQLREFIISQSSYDRRLIEHEGNEVSRDIQAPTDEWVSLRCRVNTSRITVRFGEEDEWDIEDPLLDDTWQPVLESSCGITGSGDSARVRKMTVRFHE